MNQRLIGILLAVAAPSILRAGESVSLPLDEFKTLYRERIERELGQQAKERSATPEPQVVTLDEGRYRLTLGPRGGEVEVLIAGRILSGTPAPIPLFAKMTCTGNPEVAGGSLIALPEDKGLGFLPAAATSQFRVGLRFAAPPREDARSRIVQLNIPSTIRNTLELALSDEFELVEEPGVPAGNGQYHLPGAGPLVVRFAEKRARPARLPIELESLCVIRIQGRKAIITASFAPLRPLPPDLVLRVPPGAEYLSASLPASSVVKTDEGSYRLQAPADGKTVFSVQFAVGEAGAEGSFAFALPQITDSGGREGFFTIEEPEDGRIAVTKPDSPEPIPVSRLSKALQEAAGRSAFCRQTPADKPIAFNLQRYRTVSTPRPVLDCQYFFTSMEENGNMLSVLVMDVPKDTGARLRIGMVPGAEIWSLAVNGQPQKVYSADDAWMIPLAENRESRVELAFLQKGEKLALRGRIETTMPPTGLPARQVCVGIGLPEHVDLLTVEGPVSAAQGKGWKFPADFTGRPHTFSRSFHKGEEMKLALFYEQPAKAMQQ